LNIHDPLKRRRISVHNSCPKRFRKIYKSDTEEESSEKYRSGIEEESTEKYIRGREEEESSEK
jgi:hypothetical protein